MFVQPSYNSTYPLHNQINPFVEQASSSIHHLHDNRRTKFTSTKQHEKLLRINTQT
jgi:hypothetical protein